MTHAKSAAFPLPQQRTAHLAQALTHPARLAILQLLADRRRRFAGEICAALPLARTTVSQHLVALRKLGLLRAQAQGLTLTYWLDTVVMGELVRQVGGFLAELAFCPLCRSKTGCGCGPLGVKI
nr:helix-turn-helix transcriptional regulator [Hymenobacter arizonensis]